MSEITKTVLPQISASNAAQGAASRARDASASSAQGTDAFSRVLDQQLSNRREAARSEESARARGAESEAPREKAAAPSESARPEGTEKAGKTDGAEKEGATRESAARDTADTTGKAVATDAGSSAQAAAGIAALLPGLAADVAKSAGAGPDGTTADATDAVGRQAAAGQSMALLVRGDMRSSDGADPEGGSVPADASAASAPDAKNFTLPGVEAKVEGTDAAALSGKTVPQVKHEADGDALPSAALPAKEAAALSASAADGAAATATSTGSDGAAAQMSMQPGATARPQGTATHQPMPAYIATPAGQPGWAEDVGNRVVLLAGRDEGAAELILTPPHLGRVEVSLRVTGEHTTAHFVAATPAARDALDQAMPRLREVLAEAGIALGDANVNTQAQQQRGDGGSGSGHYRQRYGNDMAGESPVAASQTWLRRSDGLIDTFA